MSDIISSGSYLISTPCAFSGEYSSDSISLLQMVGNAGDYRHLRAAGPFEHHFFVLQVPIAVSEDGALRWQIDPELMLALASLIYGKRIRSHGEIWMPIGGWSVPGLLDIVPNDYFNLSPYAGARQGPPEVACNWAALSAFRDIYTKLRRPFTEPLPLVHAARAYSEALRILPLDREIAYFRLIQALESAAASESFSEEDLYSHDDELVKHVKWLDDLTDARGRKVSQFLKKRLFQIKRSVWLWLQQHVADDFFVQQHLALSPEGLQSAIGAAYNLRSSYVHRASEFGVWIDPVTGRCSQSETVPPEFVALCPDADLKKMLSRAPTFLGLERLVRYVLMKAIRESLARPQSPSSA